MIGHVYKYPLRSVAWSASSLSVLVEMKHGARILDVQRQEGVKGPTIALWAFVDPAEADVVRRLSIVPTGVAFDIAGAAYLGTVQCGSLVWHVFDHGEVKR